MRVITILIIVGLSFGGNFWNSRVDYWGEGKKEEKVEKKNEDEYLYWTAPNVPPVIKEYFKNPDDPQVRKKLREFHLKRTFLQNKLASELMLMDYRFKKEFQEKLKNYLIYYFYSPECPYCYASQPAVNFLGEVSDVYAVNVTDPENAEYLREFRIRATPTFVFVRKRDKKEAGRWIGMLRIDEKFYEFVKNKLR